MDSIYNRTTESSLVELAKAGFSIEVTMRAYAGTLKTRVQIKKGSADYGGGIELLAEGEDIDGNAALQGAVATAETFMHAVPGGRSTPLPEAPPQVPQLAELLDPTDLRRERNRPVAEAGNAAREREDAEALSLR